MQGNKELRIFFALWPDDSIRHQLANTLSNIKLLPPGSRAVPGFNWHMTLHFIGNTSIENKDCLHRAASQVKSKPFELLVDSAGFFRRAHVLWLGCEKIPSTLFELQEDLGESLHQCGYQPETRPTHLISPWHERLKNFPR